MRGGEKVLEELCALLPEAPIHTLFHFAGVGVSRDRVARDPHQLPAERAAACGARYRSYLPLFPARGRAVRALRLRPGALDQPLRGQGRAGAAGRAPRLLLPHADALRLGPARRLLPRSRRRRRPGATSRPRRAATLGRAQRARASTPSSPTRPSCATASAATTTATRSWWRRRSTSSTSSPASDADDGAERRREALPFALMVAALAPYKKVDEAIEACAPARPRAADRRRRAGARRGSSRWREPASGCSARCRTRSSASSIATAACFVQPGVEDFGMAAVEALACGCPVVAVGQRRRARHRRGRRGWPALPGDRRDRGPEGLH